MSNVTLAFIFGLLIGIVIGADIGWRIYRSGIRSVIKDWGK